MKRVEKEGSPFLHGWLVGGGSNSMVGGLNLRERSKNIRRLSMIHVIRVDGAKVISCT